MGGIVLDGGFVKKIVGWGGGGPPQAPPPPPNMGNPAPRCILFDALPLLPPLQLGTKE